MDKYLRLALFAAAALMLALAYDLNRTARGDNVYGVIASYDPCAHEFHYSFPVAQATSGTFFAVAGDPSTVGPIVVCAQNVVVPSSSSYQLLSADAGTNCVTHQQIVTGAYAASPPGNDGSATVAVVASGQDLCYKTTGSGATGVVSYVKYKGKQIATTTSTPTFTPTATPT